MEAAASTSGRSTGSSASSTPDMRVEMNIALSDADRATLVEDVVLLQAKLAELLEQTERIRKQNASVAQENDVLQQYLTKSSAGAPASDK